MCHVFFFPTHPMPERYTAVDPFKIDAQRLWLPARRMWLSFLEYGPSPPPTFLGACGCQLGACGCKRGVICIIRIMCLFLTYPMLKRNAPV